MSKANPRDILRQVAHRPFEMPDGPWIQTQTWDDLLFAHWPISIDVMRRAVPQSLELDTFDGSAWLGVVPFVISELRVRSLPPIPPLAAFPEINVRTYVTMGGKPGVWFFSLDAARLLAVVGARQLYHLPYFHARMSVHHQGDWIVYESQRIRQDGAFIGRYRPTGSAANPAPGTLDHWLTERYCLYAIDGRGHIYRGDIQHEPWPLAPADLEIERNTMAAQFRLPDVPPGGLPLLHFSRRQQVVIWPLARL